MKGAPLTVPEARVILRAAEALNLTYESRLAAGTTFNDQERDAWIALVASAEDRIAVWEGTKRAAETPLPPTSPSSEPDRYPGGNEPDFQTLFLLAMNSAVAKSPTAANTEAQALRIGIETVLKAFGTNSAEWAQQFRALLDRVPARDERAREAGPAWLPDLAEALGKIAPSGTPLALNWTQALDLVRHLRRDVLEVCSIATTPLPEDRQVVNQVCRRWL